MYLSIILLLLYVSSTKDVIIGIFIRTLNPLGLGPFLPSPRKSSNQNSPSEPVFVSKSTINQDPPCQLNSRSRNIFTPDFAVQISDIGRTIYLR